MTVLLDTGLIYAFLNRQDAHHDEAKDLVHRIAKRQFGKPFVTDHVVDELFALIRARTGSPELEAAARRFLPLPVPQVRGMACVSLGASVLGKALEVFDRYRDQQVSFTDATLIVTLRELHIDRIATFDTRLERIVPSAR